MIRGLVHKIKDPNWLAHEFWQMFRYGLVGGGSTLFFIGLYALLSKVLLPTWNLTLLDAIATVIGAVFNFMMHRAWSFKVRAFSVAMIRRYIITITVCSVAQVAFFHVGTAWLGVMDFIVQIALVPIIAGFQYLGHRMFTFHRRFEKPLEAPLQAPTVEPERAAVTVETDAA